MQARTCNFTLCNSLIKLLAFTAIANIIRYFGYLAQVLHPLCTFYEFYNSHLGLRQSEDAKNYAKITTTYCFFERAELSLPKAKNTTMLSLVSQISYTHWMMLLIAFLACATAVYYINFKSNLSKKLKHALLAVSVCFILAMNLPDIVAIISLPSFAWNHVEASQQSDNSSTVSILSWIADAVVNYIK
jgi:hypothetical protein